MRRLGLVGALAVLGTGMTFVGARDAAACGGCFHDPNENDSPITDHRMILSVSPQQTTLYDEIEFTGVASSFAWVLPIKGVAKVGLSADLLFASLDQLTSTQVVTPPTNCPPPPTCNNGGFGEEAPTAGAAAEDAGAHGGVTVTEQQQVGPYETVQLHSTDPTALATWLTAHGYAIPSAASPVIAAYVTDGFDFLAMKLAPGQGVTAMRPVRVTTQGASPVLPLRMVAIGTGATTGITLWVVADGRWEPQNFPFFQIKDSELSWDWNTDSSNYEALRLSKEAALKGKGWEVESSLELSQFSLTNLVQSGGNTFGGAASPGAAGATAYLPVGDAGAGEGGASVPEAGAAVDAGGATDAGGAKDAAAAPDAAPPETAEQVEQDDLNTVFAGIAGPNARITRLRTDIAHAALTVDLELQASSDQSEISNIHNPTQQVGEPLCPVYNSSCDQTGTVPRSQAVAAGSPGGGGCSTTDSRTPAASGTALTTFLGLLGVVAVRARRKRRASR